MKKILVADDELSLRYLIVETLELEDYDVYQAEDGEEAVKLALEIKPEIMILDLMMPKLDGYGVLDRLQKEDKINEMKIIMLTAKAQKEDKERGISNGADVFLTKPFSPLELLDVIDRL